MSRLYIGEYDVMLNGVRLHYTVRGPRGDVPVMIAHSGGPGMDARFWDDFAGIEVLFQAVRYPRGNIS